ncbi:hypothetical protein AAF712_002986 [Marasmius tenuissimus]|uniref:Cell division cycle protein 123 n=1 Tax=Marasmius tenuissimus TaxID=585030 RepID=A0ABR3AAY8_9AGAR
MALTTYPKSYILDFQFSSWYPTFRDISIKSTIIKPLGKDFCDYLNADGIFVPKGSENETSDERQESDDEEESIEEEDEGQQYSFPELDSKIRECISEYGGAVFPKLNFSSPKDASWILPASSPLKCTSPAEIYMLLKSSDFINHDLDSDCVFEGCGSQPSIPETYELELVLRKWYHMERNREFRCFVRDNKLIAMCQRDNNYYEFLNEPETREQISTAIERFWDTKIKPRWISSNDYVFDVLLTRDLSRAHVVDFNPFATRTDPLLFTYDELDEVKTRAQGKPILRVIDSRSHPAANANVPVNQHNMVPFEALSMSSGRNIGEFADLWEQSIRESLDS